MREKERGGVVAMNMNREDEGLGVGTTVHSSTLRDAGG